MSASSIASCRLEKRINLESATTHGVFGHVFMCYEIEVVYLFLDETVGDVGGWL